MGEFLRALAFKLTGPTFANPAFGEALWDVARKATSRHIEQPDEMLNQQVRREDARARCDASGQPVAREGGPHFPFGVHRHVGVAREAEAEALVVVPAVGGVGVGVGRATKFCRRTCS